MSLNKSVAIEKIGESVLKKPIYQLKIGYGPRRVHWNGGFHGNEWMTSMILVDIIRGLVSNKHIFKKVTNCSLEEIFQNITLSVVPMVNPDGVDLSIHGEKKAEEYVSLVRMLNNGHTTYSSWKANIRGVDLNKQFPARWEEEQKRKPVTPSFRDFPGYAPLTEPESIAMARLTEYEQFDRVLCFHSQGEVIYYGYGAKEPHESWETVRRFNNASGYEPVQTVDSYAGMKDWFIDVFNKEGYTIEIGKGINPLPLSQYKSNLKKASQVAYHSLVFHGD
nr:M14 family metallocarboxypeptidase [Thalassobacillus pellis]